MKLSQWSILVTCLALTAFGLIYVLQNHPSGYAFLGLGILGALALLVDVARAKNRYKR